MKNSKLCILLVGVLALTMLAGCGKKDSAPTNTHDSAPEVTQDDDRTPDDTQTQPNAAEPEETAPVDEETLIDELLLNTEFYYKSFKGTKRAEVIMFDESPDADTARRYVTFLTEEKIYNAERKDSNATHLTWNMEKNYKMPYEEGDHDVVLVQSTERWVDSHGRCFARDNGAEEWKRDGGVVNLLGIDGAQLKRYDLTDISLDTSGDAYVLTGVFALNSGSDWFGGYKYVYFWDPLNTLPGVTITFDKATKLMTAVHAEITGDSGEFELQFERDNYPHTMVTIDIEVEFGDFPLEIPAEIAAIE